MSSATRITIEWEDGLHHQFNRLPDGTWDLELSVPEHGKQRITGYDGPNLMRVLSTAAAAKEIAA